MKTSRVLLHMLVLLFTMSLTATAFAQGADEFTKCGNAVSKAANSSTGKTVRGNWKTMHNACAKFRSCKKSCRKAKRSCKSDVRGDKKSCIAGCNKKRGKAKRSCKRSCRKTKRADKRGCRQDKRSCRQQAP